MATAKAGDGRGEAEQVLATSGIIRNYNLMTTAKPTASQ
jgi:hypothetical protein